MAAAAAAAAPTVVLPSCLDKFVARIELLDRHTEPIFRILFYPLRWLGQRIRESPWLQWLQQHFWQYLGRWFKWCGELYHWWITVLGWTCKTGVKWTGRFYLWLWQIRRLYLLVFVCLALSALGTNAMDRHLQEHPKAW